MTDHFKHLVRLVIGVWFLGVACSPADARFAPFHLDEMGLLSPRYYFVSENKPPSVTVYSLEGERVSTIKNPGGYLCCPCMHPDVADRICYASSTGEYPNLSWQVRERDLITGADRAVLPFPIDAYPFQLEAAGTRVGFLVLGEGQWGVRLFSPNSSAPRVLSPCGSSRPRVDPHRQEAWWIWSPSLAHSGDTPNPAIETTTLHSLNMEDGKHRSYEIPAGTFLQPVHWITPLAGKENTVVFVAFSKEEQAGGVLYTYDTKQKVLLERVIHDRCGHNE